MHSFHYEYKSKAHSGSLPLVQINLGPGAYCAKGVFAIGNVAIGLFGIGLLSVVVIGFGLLSFALAAFGTFAVGLFAIGQYVAIGDYARAAVAVGKTTAAGGVCFDWNAIPAEIARRSTGRRPRVLPSGGGVVSGDRGRLTGV